MPSFRAVIDGGDGGETLIDAGSLDEAIDLAATWAREGDWDTSDGTIWVRVKVTACPETIESLSKRLGVDGWLILPGAGADDDSVYVGVPIGADEQVGDPNEYFADLQRFAGVHWEASWTGNSTTDADGETVGDVVLSPSDECESDERTVAIDPDEPDCVDVAHRWRSPHRLVGGIAENPGVWGHGGGVMITECCMRCGCARLTDTWAQDPETGEQGLTSVRYEPGRWADEVPTQTEHELDDAIDCNELRACAAYVLSTLRHDHPADIRDSIPRPSRERAYEVTTFVERVQSAVGTTRALRLALYHAARNGAEARAAYAIMARLTARAR